MLMLLNKNGPHFFLFSGINNVSRKLQYKDVYRRTIEMPQRAHIFKVNYWLKVANFGISGSCITFTVTSSSTTIVIGFAQL